MIIKSLNIAKWHLPRELCIHQFHINKEIKQNIKMEYLTFPLFHFQWPILSGADVISLCSKSTKSWHTRQYLQNTLVVFNLSHCTGELKITQKQETSFLHGRDVIMSKIWLVTKVLRPSSHAMLKNICWNTYKCLLLVFILQHAHLDYLY